VIVGRINLKKIIIQTRNKTYPVYIGDSILYLLPDLITNLGLNKNIFIVVDENVLGIYKEYIKNAFRDYDSKIHFHKLDSGESSKSFNQLTKIFSSLIEKKYGRDTLLIAIGGGVAGDLSGYAAASYMRGIQLVHVPTTIISASDSAIGGKTGINFNKLKNIIGAFYQPELVLIDTKFLASLPVKEVNSGAGELIKYAFLTNKNFYNYINRNFNKIYSFDPVVLNKLIYESVLFKGSVVEKDEKESGLRKILNFGHTFAHAFESQANLKLKHGEAVIAGIISALHLSNKKGLLTKKDLKELVKLPLKVKLPVDFLSTDFNSIINFMKGDKKNREGQIRFILLSGIGKIITDVVAKKEDVRYAIEETHKTLM
jgi:3-dehydroquinate synthase